MSLGEGWQIANIAVAFVGMKYGTGGAVATLPKHLPQVGRLFTQFGQGGADKVFCSQLVVEVFRLYGLHLVHGGAASYFQPGSLQKAAGRGSLVCVGYLK